LFTCGPVANRPAWRLPTATQFGKLPHNLAWLLANDRLVTDPPAEPSAFRPQPNGKHATRAPMRIDQA